MVDLFFNKNASASRTRELEDRSRFIEVDIFEIEFSELNPRHSRGEHYKSIKASIRQSGLQNPLIITRKPGNEHYTLYYGGNTRLAILKELVDEFMALGENDQAERLRFQQCRVVPYTSDIDVLIKHMAENEERSGMTLIDKARAVARIRQMYLQQHQVDKVSQRQLVQYIHSMGWTRVNRQVMTELEFAFEHLQDVIPLALEAGLGKRKILQLRLWLKHTEMFITWLGQQGKLSRTALVNGREQTLTYSTDDARMLYFQVLSEFDTDMEEIDAEMPEGMTMAPDTVFAEENIEDGENNRLLDLPLFFEEFRYRLSDELRAFDPELTSARIDYEVEQIRIHGHVPETRPREELRQELRETATTPPPVFPEPRKPRTPKLRAENDDAGEADHADADDDDDALTVHATHGVVSLGTEAARTVPVTTLASAGKTLLQVPFGPTFALPDNNLPWLQYNAAIREACWKEIRRLFDRFDSAGALVSMVFDHDEHGTPCEEAPYINVILKDDAQFQLLQTVLEAGEDGERYAALYCLHLWDFYIAHVFGCEESGNIFTDAQKTTLANVRQLWQQYAHLYADYQTLCRTGIVHLRDGDNAGLLLLADRTICQHQGLLFAIETRARPDDADTEAI